MPLPTLASDVTSGLIVSAMTRNEALRIGDVVARTGLTERAIRHYESLGLVAPARSSSRTTPL